MKIMKNMKAKNARTTAFFMRFMSFMVILSAGESDSEFFTSLLEHQMAA